MAKVSSRHILILFLATLFAAAPAKAEPPQPASIEQSVQVAVNLVRPALVRIHVVSTRHEDGREVKTEGSGSGVIITEAGHIVTNHHVVGHATRLFCTLANKEEIEATLVGSDPLSDIAVIKLQTDGSRTFPTAKFGDSSLVKVGDPVLAMGSPMALSQSVTVGVVSNVEMMMPQWMGSFGQVEEDGEDIGSLVKWLGHDAAISPGNSGGPLVNLAGEVIGINEIHMALGGAIPSDIAQRVANELVEKGKITRAWFGMNVQPRLKHSSEKRGALVSGTITESPSEKAGIRAGDVIVELNGTAIDIQFHEQVPDFNRMVADLEIGKEVPVILVRDGQEQLVTVVPVERESVQPQEHELKRWGLTASNISMITAKEMKRSNRDGVLITSVRSGGPAGEAKPAIGWNDILVAVDGQPVKNLEDLNTITDRITDGKKDPVPVLATFDRKNEQYVTVVQVGIKEPSDPAVDVKKAWLPVETQPLTREIASLLKHPDTTGFRVASVYPDSTAAEAGLAVGDLITAVDDTPLTASAPEHYEELAALIRQRRTGDTVNLTILRGQEQMTIPVKLGRSPKPNREMKEYRDENLELTVRDTSYFDKQKEQWKQELNGVLVSEVKSGGWAALAQINPGDLILEVDATPTLDVKAFEEKMKQVAETQPQSIVFKVLRGIYTYYCEIEPTWHNE